MIIHDLYYVCWWSVHVCIDHIWTMCLLMGVLVKRTPEDVMARLRRRGSASSSKFVHPWQQQPIAEEDFEDFEENQWETPARRRPGKSLPRLTAKISPGDCSGGRSRSGRQRKNGQKSQRSGQTGHQGQAGAGTSRIRTGATRGSH